jgi:hypothetical protein
VNRYVSWLLPAFLLWASGCSKSVAPVDYNVKKEGREIHYREDMNGHRLRVSDKDFETLMIGGPSDPSILDRGYMNGSLAKVVNKYWGGSNGLTNTFTLFVDDTGTNVSVPVTQTNISLAPKPDMLDGFVVKYNELRSVIRKDVESSGKRRF